MDDTVAGPFIASRVEAMIARRAADLLRPMADAERDVRFSVADRPGVVVPIPGRALRLIADLLDSVAHGAALSLVLHDRDLTIAEAADLLDVSQSFLGDVLDRGDIPYHLVGPHRRVATADALAYRARLDEESGRAIAEMVRLQQELGLD